MTVGVNALVGVMETVFSMVLYYLMIKNEMKLSIGQFMGFSTAFGAFSGAMLQIVSSLLQVRMTDATLYCRLCRRAMKIL